MTPADLRQALPLFDDFVDRFAPLLGEDARVDRAHAYLRGLLLNNDDNKTAEAIALKVYGDPSQVRSTQVFLSQSPWEDAPLRQELVRWADTELGSPDGVLILDQSRYPKCGTKSVGGKEHRLAQRVGWLSKAGRVKLVFSRRPRERAWVALVTDATRWSMRTVLSHYLNRWAIELFFKASKQNLGLGDYQVLRYRGVVRYLHLVLIAYLLLTHLGLCAPDAQADVKGRNALRLPSIPELQTRLRGLLWDNLVTDLEKGKRTRAAARKVREGIML